jgi:hypothetical protein
VKHLKIVVPIAAVMLAGSLAYAEEGRATRAAGHDKPLLLAQAKATTAGTGKEVQQIHDHMDMMQKKMDKYHASKDQKERAKLRAELYADMRDHMKLMRGPGGMDSGRMMSGRQKQSQKMMEMRMDQMHQMLEWMFTFQSDFPGSAP